MKVRVSRAYSFLTLILGVTGILASVIYFSNYDANIALVNIVNIDTFKIDLRVIVIVYNRAHSVLRLLESLNRADYENDNVKLEVWIDRSINGTVDQLTEQTAREFRFRHGAYDVIVHPQHVGIYGQWLSTWNPNNNSQEIAVILEDDLEVSPHFYKYLKHVHSKYDHYPEINGFALQGLSIHHGVKTWQSFVNYTDGQCVYLYPVLGTWGFSPSRKNWVRFLDWYAEARKKSDFKPDVPGNVATSWYNTFLEQGKNYTMWSMWHIHFAWKHDEYTLFPNFKDHKGLTTNWMEPGLHYDANSSRQSNPLLETWEPGYENIPALPARLDINGNISSPPILNS
ncbi:uncharacterized protein LOC127858293 [Dreissena polymorpha]|uniref:Uncharacterized protein n=1 Tax=Dreissena polymorpha TaxID=45954 RepID=A0A9D4BSB3_DREPO|nr:uncharacterized protein LOC127858293 [Dreissena polymorpha]XP_052251251.1 uncharacterized protein LOC127858293 [Dreissena polymorpha]XP_052251252.1 uncharacterized protein LOC127858293 [Dreissena polymorpha]XP_052251253.1 uncharacterized protein LOC127858293 [Dreissena polymorpha]XP_052251255.1 uncharacterized protein LOC127858293 [Dreissena polymorpha]XP_052251256.1 uncharacterized protein LOC127858293 [Dreissena polymorpha]KAH3706384.1 hypothetical protein DPMN_065770 [Dreissena polymorp